jgi:hypothetical protein
MGCVDYSVSGSGAVSRHKWGWGAGGVASQPFTRTAYASPLMTVALPHASSPLRLHSLGLQWLQWSHVVQELEVS